MGGYRLPAQPPADNTADNLTRWQALMDGSTARSTLTAQTWRNGLAGFVTLLTSVLILKGSDIGDVERPWNYVVIALIGLGAGASIAGLWAALKAEAPPMSDVDYTDTIDKFGTIAAYEQDINRNSATALGHARHRVFIALLLLLAGTVIWWLAPEGSTTARLQVTWEDNGKSLTVCGKPTDTQTGEITLKVGDSDAPTVISIAQVTKLKVVTSC